MRLKASPALKGLTSVNEYIVSKSDTVMSTNHNKHEISIQT